MLPYDYSRCQPSLASSQCQGCARYADHEDQTWGERTPIMYIENDKSSHCQYIPIDREDGK